MFVGAGSRSGRRIAAARNAAFVTIGNDAALTAERSLTAGTGVLRTDGGANSTVTLAVDQAFTPTWTGDHTWNGGKITLMAGTTARAPLNFQSGTNLTTPAAGAMEYDGTVHSSTHAANERGVINSEQWICNTSTFTLTSQTAAQKMFNSPTNGAVTVAANTTYQFEGEFTLTAMSATSGDFGFAIGGTATLSSIKWWSLASKAASLSASTSWNSCLNTTASNVAVNGGGNTFTVAGATVRGLIRVTTGGTVIPQVSLGVAAAAIVGVNSFFRIWPVGTNTDVSRGNWS